MKKILSITAFVAVIILSLSSCSKCVSCTKSGGSLVRLCENDYDSHTAYGLAQDYYTGQGYNCR